MDLEFKRKDTIIAKYNVDAISKTIKKTPITETQQVHPLKNLIQMMELPNRASRVQIVSKDMIEVNDIEKVISSQYFYVDYEQGIIHFHPDVASKTIKFDYEGIGVELISANRIFTKQDEKGNIVELLSDLIDKTNDYLAILGTFEEATVYITKLQNTINTAKQTKADLDSSIEKAQDDIGKIESTGNVEIIVPYSDWVLNGDIYEKEISHDLYSENLHITAKDTTTKSACTIGWQILDKTRILLKSDVAISMSIVASASYYKPLIEGDVTQDELIRARMGEVSLDVKIQKMDELIAQLQETVASIQQAES